MRSPRRLARALPPAAVHCLPCRAQHPQACDLGPAEPTGAVVRAAGGVGAFLLAAGDVACARVTGPSQACREAALAGERGSAEFPSAWNADLVVSA